MLSPEAKLPQQSCDVVVADDAALDVDPKSLPAGFEDVAKRFKLSPARLAYLLCCEFALYPPDTLTVVSQALPFS